MAASRPQSAVGLAARQHDPPVDDAIAPLAPAARIDRLLWREPVIWLSSVRPDDAPHLVPIWFSWDGAAILVASKPYARKVANIRFSPAVMIALGEAEAGERDGTRRGHRHPPP